MYLELLRRHGEKLLPGRYVRGGKVDLDELFGCISLPFRDIPDDVLDYSCPEDFHRLPFHVVFNIAMSVLPVVMYADVLPFRVYHYYSSLYVWGKLHRAPGVVWEREGGEGRLRVARYDGTKLYARLNWVPKVTYAGVSKAYVGRKNRLFSGDVSAFEESTAYTSLNSWYMPGQLALRLPYYDTATFEFLIGFVQNLCASVDWRAVDATGGGKSIAFFDDSTTCYLPYGWVPFYGKRSEGVTPLGLLVRGYGEHLFLWVAKAFSLAEGKEDLQRDILHIFCSIFGEGGCRRLRKYLRGRHVRALDELLSELAGSENT